MQTLQTTYDEQLKNKQIKPDAQQKAAIKQLVALQQAVHTGQPTQGVYLYGPVGRGKSMVMHLFFETLQVPSRRVHFHAFMEELHERMHTLPPAKGQDAMQRIAEAIKEDATVLCFDEFYITNIADAMLLGRLFEKLFAAGVTVCATSNWPPEDLFQGGINRDRFMPFIRQIEHHMQAVAVDGTTDYRQQKGEHLPLWHVGEDADFLTQHFAAHTPKNAAKNPANTPKIPLVAAKGNTAWIRGDILCNNAFGRDEYFELAHMFQTLIVEDLPTFPPNDADAALRFITLIDIWYEAKHTLIVTAADTPENLCQQGDAAAAFQRTASRIREMQGW